MNEVKEKRKLLYLKMYQYKIVEQLVVFTWVNNK